MNKLPWQILEDKKAKHKKAMEDLVVGSLSLATERVLEGAFDLAQCNIDRAHHYLNLLRFEDDLKHLEEEPDKDDDENE